MLGGDLSDLAARPLLCLTLAFAAGIALAAAWGIPAVVILAASAAFLNLLRRRPRDFAATALLGLSLVAGACVLSAHRARPADDISRLPEGGQTIVGAVASAPRFSYGAWHFLLRATHHLAGPDSPQDVQGAVYVHFHSNRPIHRGERWRLTGRLRHTSGPRNPGGKSPTAWISATGATSALTVGSPDLAEFAGDGDLGPLARNAYRQQRAALAALRRYVGGPYGDVTAAVAASVVFGVRAASPPPEIVEVFRRSGTIHLLVVSGAMVSTLFGLIFLPSVVAGRWREMAGGAPGGARTGEKGRVRWRPGVCAAVIAVLVATYYAVLTEGGQAVARAAITGGFVGLAMVLRRVPRVAREHGLNVDYYTLLAAAGLAILVVQPEALFRAGFQLSFAAVWAILFLTARGMWAFGWLPRWLAFIVVGTVAAQLATFPILVWHYGQAPVAGLAANLLAIPLAGVVLVGGMATCALGVAAPWAAPAAGWVTGVATRGMVWVSSAFGMPPWASVEVQRPPVWLVVVWYAGLVALGWWLGKAASRGTYVGRVGRG
jgi:competence protein ComEC